MSGSPRGPRRLELSLAVVLLALLGLLQRQIWWSRDSVAANQRIARRIHRLEVRLRVDRFRDDLLHADVRNLERGQGALAAAVRYNLGYVRPGESFYQVMIDDSTPQGPSGQHSRHTVRPAHTRPSTSRGTRS